MESLSFKDACRQDIDTVFMNVDEFSGTHVIDGKTMTVHFDDLEHIEREKRMKSTMDGLSVRQILVYVKASEFGPLPARGRALVLDGKRYIVVDAADENGIYTLTLEANRSK